MTSVNPISKTKADRLRAAYESFRDKTRVLREERLEFMKREFRKLDEQRINQLREQLK